MATTASTSAVQFHADQAWQQYLEANTGIAMGGGTAGRTTLTGLTADAAAMVAAASAPVGPPADAMVAAGAGAGAGAATTTHRKKVAVALKSKAGLAILCILAVFVVSMILLAAIQPDFVKKEPESKLETPKVSGAKVAAGAAVTAAVAGVAVGVLYLVQAKKVHKKIA
jgi:hypothetical protein